MRYSGQFNSSNNMSQIFDQILEGKTEFSTICDDLNEMINIIYITKYEELCKNLNKYYIK